jgi:hypothetical protein
MRYKIPSPLELLPSTTHVFPAPFLFIEYKFHTDLEHNTERFVRKHCIIHDLKSLQVLISTVHGSDAKWTVIVLSGQNPAL